MRNERQIRDEAFHWVTRLEDSELSEREWREFEQWIDACSEHKKHFEESMSVARGLRTLTRRELRHEVSQPLLRERLMGFAKLGGGLQRHFVGFRLIRPIAATACLILLLMLVSPEFPNSLLSRNADIEVASYAADSTLTNVTLPDGSSMVLAHGSVARIRFDTDRRAVSLASGAAFFDVVRDKARPFSVNTGHMLAVVTGTKFEVKNAGAVSRVSVQEGSVTVDTPGVQSAPNGATRKLVMLSAGDTVHAAKGSEISAIQKTVVSDVGAWRDGRLVYTDALIFEVIEDARRYETRPIIVDGSLRNSDPLRISGFYSISNIPRMLRSLGDVHPVDVLITEEFIRLSLRPTD